MTYRQKTNAGAAGVVFFVSLVACGGTSTGRDGSSGGSAGSGEGGGAGEGCLVREDSAPNPDDICDGLDRIKLTDLGIADEDGDGRIALGEAFTASFELRDTSGFGFDYYPGVKYAVEPAGVALSPESDFAAYALHPCESMKSGTRVTFESTVGSGTIIELTARAAALNQDCPSAPSSTIRVEIVE